jgi:hypothetical protein
MSKLEIARAWGFLLFSTFMVRIERPDRAKDVAATLNTAQPTVIRNDLRARRVPCAAAGSVTGWTTTPMVIQVDGARGPNAAHRLLPPGLSRWSMPAHSRMHAGSTRAKTQV